MIRHTRADLAWAAGLKSKAHVAFVAYEAAMREGDHERAKICLNRFRQASSALAMWRTAAGGAQRVR